MATNVLSNKQYPGNILTAFLPKQDSKSTTTTTEKTDISQEGIDAIIRSMMEGDSGLAALMTGQSKAGIYNSTTSSLLANDLANRTAGTAALASAPKTTTQVQKTPSNQIDPKWLLGLQLVGELFGGGGSTPSGQKQTNAPGNNSLGAAFDNLFGTNVFTGTVEKDWDEEFDYNAAEDYGGFGFTGDDFANFSLGGYGDFSLSSGYSGGGYDPYSFGGSTDWLGTGYSGSGYDSYNYSYAPSNYSLGFAGGGDTAGLSFGFSF